MENEFLRLVGTPNEFLRLIIKHYIFKHSFRIKTTSVVSLRSKKSFLRAQFRDNLYKDLGLARSDFFKVYGAPNESLRLIILNYMFKFTFGIKTNSLESLRN